MMLSLAIAALLCTDTGVAPAAPVSVDYSPPILTVSVTEPMSLAVVVLALCEGTGADCDPLPKVSSWPTVAPMTLAGSWEVVVGKLLADSGIGYATVPPANGRRARLIVEEGLPRMDDSVEAEEGGVSVAGTSGAVDEEPDAGGWDPMAEREVAASALGDDAGGVEDPDTGDSLSTLVLGGPAAFTERGDGQVVSGQAGPTPAATASGGPLLAPVSPRGRGETPGWVSTPFTDDYGEALTLPETTEIYPVAPFSDSHGEPIPLDLGPENPKLEYPIPPTPLRAPEPHPERPDPPASGATAGASPPP